MPLVRSSLDPEAGHKFAVKVLGSGFAPRDMRGDSETLTAEIWGHKLSNPVGIAAGFDKDGEAIEGLFNLGFSWVEIGSVTPKPQPGNPKPRVFHLPEDSAIINRYGFPSQGHAIVLSRLRSFLASNPPSSASSTILAVNLGKNKTSAPDSTADFLSGVAKFGPLVDVLVINVSSPNTPGLRALQGRGMLEELLSEVVSARDKLPERSRDEWKWSKAKIVVKIAPDLSESQVQDIAEAVKTSGVDGVIVSNTTVERPAELQSINAVEAGGLSGAPLRPFTMQALKVLRHNLPAAVPIIGCGGIGSGADALEYAANGASLVQLYTSFSYDGVGFPRRLKDEIEGSLKAKNASWASLVSSSVDSLALKPQRPEDVFKKQTEELKATLDAAGKRIALGEEFSVLKEKVKSALPSAALTSAGAPTTEKSLEDLVREVEAALGISSTH